MARPRRQPARSRLHPTPPRSDRASGLIGRCADLSRRTATNAGESIMVQQKQSMADRTVLVTGGTAGIGKATAIGLAALGARLAIAGRDLRRAKAAAVDIR